MCLKAHWPEASLPPDRENLPLELITSWAIDTLTSSFSVPVSDFQPSLFLAVAFYPGFPPLLFELRRAGQARGPDPDVRAVAMTIVNRQSSIGTASLRSACYLDLTAQTCGLPPVGGVYLKLNPSFTSE